MANIFISYRNPDEEVVTRLYNDLKAAGHTVWFAPEEVGIGDSIVEKIDQGLAGATYLVMCYSAKGIHSKWMSKEWMSALARQLGDQSIKILPVMLESGQPPAILADIRYANLAADWQRGLTELLRAIK